MNDGTLLALERARERDVETAADEKANEEGGVVYGAKQQRRVWKRPDDV